MLQRSGCLSILNKQPKLMSPVSAPAACSEKGNCSRIQTNRCNNACTHTRSHPDMLWLCIIADKLSLLKRVQKTEAGMSKRPSRRRRRAATAAEARLGQSLGPGKLRSATYTICAYAGRVTSCVIQSGFRHGSSGSEAIGIANIDF